MAKTIANSKPTKIKLRKGDRVMVLSGKDAGKSGEVLRVLPREGRVIVEGVHRVKRHQRTTQARKPAGIIDKDLPVPVSILAIECPKEHKPVKIGYAGEGESKKRVCRSCGAEL